MGFVKNQSPANTNFTFRKVEKLCSEKIIAELFQPGFFVSVYPFRINGLFTSLPSDKTNAQVMFVVGKKKFKKAHDRNRAKRVMRELYRLEKHKLYHALASQEKQLALALIYTGTDLPNFHESKVKFDLLLIKLIHAISNQ